MVRSAPRWEFPVGVAWCRSLSPVDAYRTTLRHGFPHRVMFTETSPRKDLDPWVTAPIFEDECNSMDPIHAMVSGRPPFPGAACGGDSGISSGQRDSPSPPRVRPGGGPLDGLWESWETGEDEAGGVGTDEFAVAPAADAASMREFMETYEGLGGASLPGGVPPEAARVGEPISGGDLSTSTPLLAQAHATALDGVRQPGDAVPAGGPCQAPNRASATPPPVPTKPDSVTAAFLVKERVEGANEAATGEAAADGGSPGTVSSQDLLLEWLRREAGQGDEEAQFHLAQLFSPPRFEMKPKCRECGEDFGVTRYRHHCRHCGGSFCHEHAWHEHPIPKLGLPAPQVWNGMIGRVRYHNPP